MEEMFRPKGLNLFREKLYQSSFYKAWLRQAQSIKPDYPDCAPPLGGALFSCRGDILTHARHQFKIDENLWTRPLEYQNIVRFLHGFCWLETIEDPILAERIILAWIEENQNWKPLIWDTDNSASRFLNWCFFCHQHKETISPVYFEKIQCSLMMQGRFLLDRRPLDLDGFSKIYVMFAQTFAQHVLFPDRLKAFLKSLKKFTLTLDSQMLEDGGHQSRCPQTFLDILELLDCLKTLTTHKKIETPRQLTLIQENLLSLIKSVMTPTGQLGVFQGSNQGNSSQLKNLSIPHGQAQNNAPNSGYQRLTANQTVLMMDYGFACAPEIHNNATNAFFAFELWDGHEPIITNCGQFENGPPEWQDALKASRAHSCLVIDDKDMQPLGDDNPTLVEVHRVNDKGNIFIETSHNGYLKEFGLVHKRALFMNAAGTDLRFEDQLIGAGGNRFCIHLHLHPDVMVKDNSDDNNFLIQLPSGSCWQLNAGAVELSIEDSLYCGRTGIPEKSQQITLSGPLRGQGALIKWRLNKLGDPGKKL